METILPNLHMYTPKPFAITDQSIINQIIYDNSFATLVSGTEGSLVATHIPLLLNPSEQVLFGHIARQNPQGEVLDDRDILAIFQGPHAYISPSWYETNKSVPTWNYLSVHVYGKASLVRNEEELRKSLDELILKYEGENSPFFLRNMDEKYINALIGGIIGIKIKITKIEATAKLSQNHSLERKNLVIQELEKQKDQNANEIAKWMRENLNA
ncbi:protease synthase and sporulation protein PAI 2 [Leptospira kobayashii]|uniref:Protease synthase and sporulation protein PAI 2 n=1 Tax=Leptospira kobayashii TaxID=1917830 RepID=A0ABM7UML0_9LEPT|nr:FMN-binding negative transcriptional regulator [Leptospira kobayashii]BDA80318.1 protease synthase and sporulation protein PAI 2 [Leptospira kobayashii]